MPAAAVHPSREVLAAFGSGQLADHAASTVSQHLEQCATCTALVADLEPDSFAAKLENAKPSGSSIPPGRGSTRVSGLSSMGKNSSPAGAPVLELPVELEEHSKFRIIRELGRGGMGVVYLAEHKIMGRQVALKVLNPAILDSPDALPRFVKEVQAAAQLDHANIVRAHDAEQAGNLHFLVMEFVEGTDLAKLVDQKGTLTPSIACYFGRQAALGLQHAHEHGMTHRDIKPHNLMVTPKGQIKVLDFGLARVRSEGRTGGGLTAAEAFMGTPEYVAPEQATDARQADIRSDIYSLGCTLYYLLTGRPPFREGTVVKTVLAQINKAPQPLHEIRPEIPAELSALVDKMLAKDPAKRFQTPGEVAQALAPFVKRGAKGELPAALPPSVASPGKGTALAGDSSRVKEPGQGASQLSAKKALSAKPTKSLVNLEDARVSAPKRKPKSDAAKLEAAPAWKRPSLVAGVAVAVLALILGGLAASGVFKVKTKDGTIVLENLPPDADVTVDGDMVLVKSSDGKTVEIRVAPGKKHRLEIKKDGFKVFGEEVELDAGGRQPITARLEPLSVAAAKPATTNTTGASKPGRFPLQATVRQPVIGVWEVENEELVMVSRVEKYGSRIRFGDTSWTDFDFTVEAKRTALNDGFGLIIGATANSPEGFFAVGGRFNSVHHLNIPWDKELVSMPGSIETDKWYTALVRVRGNHVQTFLDGVKVFDVQTESSPAGSVGLATWASLYRFRNIKVTDPDGKVLLEGLPDLGADNEKRVAQTLKVLTPAEAAGKEGENVTVQFVVKGRGSNGEFVELYSEPQWNSDGCFFLRFPESVRDKFQKLAIPDVVPHFVDKRVRVTGIVQILRFADTEGSFPCIQIENPSQIQISEEVLTPAQAAGKEGEHVTVQFVVKGNGTNGEFVELYSEPEWQRDGCFFIRFPESIRDKFQELSIPDVVPHFVDKRIRVTGIVQILRFSEGSFPCIQLENTSQIQISDPP